MSPITTATSLPAPTKRAEKKNLQINYKEDAKVTFLQETIYPKRQSRRYLSRANIRIGATLNEDLSFTASAGRRSSRDTTGSDTDNHTSEKVETLLTISTKEGLSAPSKGIRATYLGTWI